MSKKLLICFVMLLTYASTALAQTKISGTVVGAEDNQPVIGATIMVVGTKAGVVTDVDGKFSLTTDVANPQVTVGYIGMVSQTLKGTTDMKVVLKSSTQALKEVVVTGLTRTDRRLFTGATDKVDADKARLSGVADISRSLEGQAAGLFRTSVEPSERRQRYASVVLPQSMEVANHYGLSTESSWKTPLTWVLTT